MTDTPFDELDDESDEAALRLVVERLIHLFEGYMSVYCPAVGVDDAYLCGSEILMFRIVLLEKSMSRRVDLKYDRRFFSEML